MSQRIAVITDSNSGITQDQAQQMGIGVVPMPFRINDVEYFEEIDLSQKQFYEKLAGDETITTSQPSPASLMEIWDLALKDHDQVVYLPMSSGLSCSCQTAKMLAKDYDGKVQVVNNQRISVTQRNSVTDALYLAGQGKNAEEIRIILEEEKFNSTIYITLDTLYYLKKGGRITPAAAALGTLLKIKPVLQIQGEKLDAFRKARTMTAAKATMIAAVKADLDNRLTPKGTPYENAPVCIGVAHTNCEEEAQALMEELKTIFPQAAEYCIAPLALSIACHTGPGALGIAATRLVR